MTSKKTPVEAPTAPDSFPVTLSEFCTGASGQDRRVELIGAFEAQMKRQGLIKARPEVFAAEYQNFAGLKA